MVTFVQATFVLATFVHIRNISGPDYDETLKIGSLEHLEQIPTVTLTFVQATFVLVTFVHIRNISAVSDSILMKLYDETLHTLYLWACPLSSVC